jgi:hypothetical protein
MISTMPVATVKNSSNGCANVINACCYYYHCSDGPNCAHGYNNYHLFAIVLFCNSDIYIYIYIYIYMFCQDVRMELSLFNLYYNSHGNRCWGTFDCTVANNNVHVGSRCMLCGLVNASLVVSTGCTWRCMDCIVVKLIKTMTAMMGSVTDGPCPSSSIRSCFRADIIIRSNMNPFTLIS